MVQEYISKQDMIIVTAIEIISDSGLLGLTFDNLAMKSNMTVDFLYKYYGDINEVLVDVVKYYFKFDKRIFSTVSAKQTSYLDKLKLYVEEYAEYYENYYALSNIMLHYEELLHNIYTRELITEGSLKRREFLKEIFEGAIREGEITADCSPDELALFVTGNMIVLTLNRRMVSSRSTFKNDYMNSIRSFIKLCRK